MGQENVADILKNMQKLEVHLKAMTDPSLSACTISLNFLFIISIPHNYLLRLLLLLLRVK